jgi:hypothetical protein
MSGIDKCVEKKYRVRGWRVMAFAFQGGWSGKSSLKRGQVAREASRILTGRGLDGCLFRFPSPSTIYLQDSS